ncbi:MAG: glycerophosphodiester phosphodiesterase [Planctomycetes bacterium]|nr:glycerophosphodiester phosphodiesterase [Planctomycetota bacterium]
MAIAAACTLFQGACATREPAAAPKSGDIEAVHFQAHRGGLREAPENTLAAYRRAWGLGGMPEADLRTTSDGVIIILHDATLGRTTDAPAPIDARDVSTLTFREIREWDAGAWFAPEYAGERVPSLAEVFSEMQGRPERQLYLDLKVADLEALGEMIGKYGIGRQIIFSHNRAENLTILRRAAPEVRTMLWIGGGPEEIERKFRQALDSGFRDMDQVQLHLNRPKGQEGAVSYLLDAESLRFALEKTRSAGVDLEVLPAEFDQASLSALLDLGIRWYATDYPARFVACVDAWRRGARIRTPR